MTGRLKTPAIDLRLAQVAATLGQRVRPRPARAGGRGRTTTSNRASDAMVGAAIIDPYRTRRRRLPLPPRPDARRRLRDPGARGAPGHPRHHRRHPGRRGRRRRPARPSLRLAGDPARGVPQYITAAQEALGRGAHLEAIRMLTRAIEGTELLPEGEDRDVTELTAPDAARAECQLDPGLRLGRRRRRITAGSRSSQPGWAPTRWSCRPSSASGRTGWPAATTTPPPASPGGSRSWSRTRRWRCSGPRSRRAAATRPSTTALWTRPRNCSRWPTTASPPVLPMRSTRRSGRCPNDSIAVITIALATIAALQGDVDGAAEVGADRLRAGRGHRHRPGPVQPTPSSTCTPRSSAASRTTTAPPGGSAPTPWPSARSTATPTG